MLAFFISCIIATLTSPLVIKVYRNHGWVDDPNTEKHAKKTHKNSVPRGGGIIIFIAVTICSLLFLQLDKHLLAILTGALILTVVGTLDDIFDIHPAVRLGTGILAALIVVGSGIGIAYVSNPFGHGVIHLDQPQFSFSLFDKQHTIWILADFFAVLFILWNMNIVNWSKGVDGQMPGFVSIALIFVGLLSTKFIDDPTSFNTAALSFISSGAFAGLLIWNWYPQKILPGYGAGSLAGYFLAVLAIISGAKVATVLMVLGIPTADAIFTITRRIRAGKSPLWGDRGHLHHKLLDVLKWGRRRIAVFYWVTSFLLGVSSLYLNTIGKLLTMFGVLILVFSFLIWAKLQTVRQKRYN